MQLLRNVRDLLLRSGIYLLHSTVYCIEYVFLYTIDLHCTIAMTAISDWESLRRTVMLARTVVATRRGR